jgi:hypothetical protein
VDECKPLERGDELCGGGTDGADHAAAPGGGRGAAEGGALHLLQGAGPGLDAGGKALERQGPRR